MAAAEGTGRSLVDIRAEMKRQAEAMAARIGKPGGDFIKIQTDKNFKLPDGTVNPGPMRVVVLEFVAGNFFYDRPYKEGESVPPACFAIGLEPETLVPHASSPDKQHENCKGCPNNVFGSNGAGKACGNSYVLAVVPPTDDPNEPILNIKLSATAVRPWDAYVKTIMSQFEAHPIAVETDIYFDPSSKYASLRFGNPSPNERLELHFTRQKAARERLLTPPDVSTYTAPKKGGKK